MARTTIDIDPVVLRELKRRARMEGTTVGRLVSRLVATSMHEERGAATPSFSWTTSPMQALVDLRDKDALHRALDGA
jgi:hypothetical protein